MRRGSTGSTQTLPYGTHGSSRSSVRRNERGAAARIGRVDVEWEDVGLDREIAAPEALAFVRSVFAAPSGRQFDAAFSTNA